MELFERYYISYRQPSNNASDLKETIKDATASIDKDTLENVFKGMETCLCFVLREGNEHFEH